MEARHAEGQMYRQKDPSLQPHNQVLPITSASNGNAESHHSRISSGDNCATEHIRISGHGPVSVAAVRGAAYLPRKSSWSGSLSNTSNSSSCPGTSWTMTWGERGVCEQGLPMGFLLLEPWHCFNRGDLTKEGT